MDSGFDQNPTPTPSGRGSKHRRRTCQDQFTQLLGDMRATFDELQKIWDRVDMDEEMREQRIARAFQHNRELYRDFIESEEEMALGVKNNIANNCQQIAKMRRKLDLPEWRAPVGMTMESIKMLRLSDNELATLKQKFDQKLEEQRDVTKRLSFLCSRLGELSDFTATDEDGDEDVISAHDLKMLKDRCDYLESLYQERIERCKTLCADVQRAMRILNRDMSSLDVELQDIAQFDAASDQFDLTEEYVDAVAEAAGSLIGEAQERIATLEFMYEEAWISLQDAYEKCLVPRDQWTFPRTFDIDAYSPNTIDEMRCECEKLMAQYETRRAVFEKLDEWKKLWAEKLAFDQFEKDPNRFHNRGGELSRRLRRGNALTKVLLPNAVQALSKAYAEFKEQHPYDDVKFDDLNPTAWVQSQVERHEATERVEMKSRTRTPLRSRQNGVPVEPPLHGPNVSVITPTHPSTPGPKTSSPKTAMKRRVPAGASPCPSPAKKPGVPNTPKWKP